MQEYCEHHVGAMATHAELEASTKSAHHRLTSHDKSLEEHGRRIGDLERTDERINERLGHVCKQLERLVRSIWGLLAFGGTTMVGMLIWLLQEYLKAHP